jgi:hypothetical protein
MGDEDRGYVRKRDEDPDVEAHKAPRAREEAPTPEGEAKPEDEGPDVEAHYHPKR